MHLQSFVDDVREQMLTAAEGGSEEVRAAAERMTRSIDSVIRLVLLEALSAAADEITLELAPGSVEVRLRGSDPEFAVTAPLAPADEAVVPHPAVPLSTPTAGDADEGGTARITLRLPDQLKARIEDAAGREGLSVNAWLVRALTAATDGAARRSASPAPVGAQTFTGWVR